MASTAAPTRWEQIDAFVLHTYPYKETSLIVEALCASMGRIALVAKGAKRPTSPLRGVLQPFLPLVISFVGKGEVKTLTKAEWRPGQSVFAANALMTGYYVNELVLKLIARDDAHTEIFEPYASVIASIAQAHDPHDAGTALRSFELSLLQHLGFGINLTHCADTNAPITPTGTYGWVTERGVVASDASAGFPISGAVLCALASKVPLKGAQANEAKRLLRHVLEVHLERRALASRRLMHEVQALVELQ